MPFNLKGPELLILILIVLLLFGAKRMPEAARSLGRSLRIFKAETKGLMDSDAPTGQVTSAPAAGVPAPEVVIQVQPGTGPAPVEPAPQTPPGQPRQA